MENLTEDRGTEEQHGEASAVKSEPKATQARKLRSDAYAKYQQALQSVAAGIQKRHEEAYSEYQKSLKDLTCVQRNIQKRYEDAYRAYATAAQKAASGAQGAQDAQGVQAAQNVVGDAYREYGKVSQELLQHQWESQRYADDAYRDYLKTLGEIWNSSAAESAPKCYEEALRGYLRDLQEYWLGVNTNTLDLRSLSTLGWEIASVASAAAALSPQAAPTYWAWQSPAPTR